MKCKLCNFENLWRSVRVFMVGRRARRWTNRIAGAQRVWKTDQLGLRNHSRTKNEIKEVVYQMGVTSTRQCRRRT